MIALRISPSFALDMDRQGVFARIGTREFYLRRDASAAPAWGRYRDAEGALEVEAGRMRLTVSKRPPTAIGTA